MEPLDADATRALRKADPELLRAGLLRVIVDSREVWERDWRDLLLALAPYHDCARRLGLDPAEVFDEAAERSPESLRDVVRRFGRREDVNTAGFGFYVEETPDGPRYRFAWPK
jgi:hypothetical protein